MQFEYAKFIEKICTKMEIFASHTRFSSEVTLIGEVSSVEVNPIPLTLQLLHHRRLCEFS